MANNWECRIQKRDYGHDYFLIVSKEHDDGGLSALSSMEYVVRKAGELVDIHPPLISRDVLQAMMEGLWGEGFRPAGYVDQSANLASVQHHLTDMRHLAFTKIGVKLP